MMDKAQKPCDSNWIQDNDSIKGNRLLKLGMMKDEAANEPTSSLLMNEWMTE
jgi:hypothetical protein